MKNILRLSAALFLAALALPAAERPRVIVLTDMENEPDHAMSLVRFLAYCNHWDVEGFIATTSVQRSVAKCRNTEPNS